MKINGSNLQKITKTLNQNDNILRHLFIKLINIKNYLINCTMKKIKIINQEIEMTSKTVRLIDRKFCPFSNKKSPNIDYKDVKLLSKYISEKGKIIPSRITNVSRGKQKNCLYY